MSDLSDDARTLLARAREGGGRAVDPAALARVRRNVMGRVGLAAAAGAVGTVIATKSAAAPAAPVAAWVLAAKALGGLAVVGVVAAGSVALERRLTTPAAMTTPAASASVRATASVRAAATASDPEGLRAPPAAATTNIDSAPATVGIVPVAGSSSGSVQKPALSPPQVTRARSAFARPAEVETPPAAAWADDLVLLRGAQSSIVAGDLREARRLAERVAPGGPFADEREALLAVAECGIARTSSRSDADAATEHARRRAATFTSAHAGTTLAARVTAACSDLDPSIP